MLTTHLYLVPMLKIRGAIPPPQYAFIVWYMVKHRENFTFTLMDSEGEKTKHVKKDRPCTSAISLMFKTVTWVYRTDTIMTASSNGEELVCN
jgi:hypothetical protein